MKKKTGLTENEIRENISEIDEEVVPKSEGMVFDIDISKIDVSTLKKIYRDFRLTSIPKDP